MRIWLPVWIFVACDFSAATATFSDSADTAAATQADTDTDTDADSDSDTDSDTDTKDADGDGYDWDDGDCNDDDPQVHPGAVDSCDGADTDCDGQIDEAASDADPYEPNDISGSYLGTLEDSDISVSGLLHNNQDVDRFEFDFTDEYFDFFTIRVVLSNIPDDGNYRLTLNRLATDGDLALGEVDQAFSTGGSIEFNLEDEIGPDEGGTYEAVVEAIANADCERTYLLTVEKL
jgi:hypothetical protein